MKFKNWVGFLMCCAGIILVAHKYPGMILFTCMIYYGWKWFNED